MYKFVLNENVLVRTTALQNSVRCLHTAQVFREGTAGSQMSAFVVEKNWKFCCALPTVWHFVDTDSMISECTINARP